MILQYISNTGIQYFVWVLHHTLTAGLWVPQHIGCILKITFLIKRTGHAIFKGYKGKLRGRFLTTFTQDEVGFDR